MPARTYDFSNYQGGLESLEQGAAQGFTGVDAIIHGLRRRRITDANADIDERIKQQTDIDANARANAEAGGGSGESAPVAAPGAPGGPAPISGVRVGESFVPARPAMSGPGSLVANSGGSEAAPAPGAPTGLMGRVASVRAGVGRVLSHMTGADEATPTMPSPSFHRTGPSDAQSIAAADVAGRTTVAGIDAASRRDVAGIEDAGRRYDADLRYKGDLARVGVDRERTAREFQTAAMQGGQVLVGSINDRLRQLDSAMKDPNLLMNHTDPNERNEYLGELQDERDELNEEMRGAATTVLGNGNPASRLQLSQMMSVEPQLVDLRTRRRQALARVTGNDGNAAKARAEIEQAYQAGRQQLLGLSLQRQGGAPPVSGMGTGGAGRSY